VVEIADGIFVGNQDDFYSLRDKKNWVVLHCCKEPFHVDFVGYRGQRSLPPNHPDYAYKIIGQEMALNLVDMNTFDGKYLDFDQAMFEKAFDFLDRYRSTGKRILIHCNQGESRGPCIGMLYAAKLGVFGYVDFDTTYSLFSLKYPGFNPKKNIYLTVKNLWNQFVKQLNDVAK
jgi:hypothetical protein